jgi:hypothetical protein
MINKLLSPRGIHNVDDLQLDSMLNSSDKRIRKPKRGHAKSAKPEPPLGTSELLLDHELEEKFTHLVIEDVFEDALEDELNFACMVSFQDCYLYLTFSP